eukprot:14383591-Alexandrium_andersonii.AAC.1
MGPPNAHVQLRGGSGPYCAIDFRGDVPVISGFREFANLDSHGNVQNTPFYGEEAAVVAKSSVHLDFDPGVPTAPDSLANPRRFPYAG